MPVTQYSQIKPGLLVSIVLKADQRTGRQVQGTVSQLLTRHNHPRGIKVKLTDGRVGRVQQILPQNQYSNSRQQRTMESNNPWADASSQNTSSNAGQPAQGSTQQSYPPQTQFSPYYSSQQQQHQPQQQSAAHAPSQGVRRTDTDQLLEQQEDRAAQVEHMQQFEANAPQSEGDRIQAQLQKEFPNIDSSLIAAIYNERPGNLPEVREMLQELNTN